MYTHVFNRFVTLEIEPKASGMLGKLETSPSTFFFFLYFVFEIGSTFSPGLPQIYDSPVSVSWIAGITVYTTIPIQLMYVKGCVLLIVLTMLLLQFFYTNGAFSHIDELIWPIRSCYYLQIRQLRKVKQLVQTYIANILISIM
jgi:hypothetical protein